MMSHYWLRAYDIEMGGWMQLPWLVMAINFIFLFICFSFIIKLLDITLYPQEFHEIPFLKKFKFKRQDKVLPKESPSAPATSAPTTSASSAASMSECQSAPSGLKTSLTNPSKNRNKSESETGRGDPQCPG